MAQQRSVEDERFHFYEPSPRHRPLISASTEELYLYAGWVKNFRKSRSSPANIIHIYDPYTEEWRETPTKGTPPQGLYSGTVTYSDNFMYVYGGSDRVSWNGLLYQLDTTSFTWTQISPEHKNGPLKKVIGGMIFYNNSLLIIGGIGISLPINELQQDTEFIKDRRYGEYRGRTNEVHLFNIAEGTWSSPPINGTRPPPCSGFTLNKISPTQAILLGGLISSNSCGGTFLLDLTEMKFTKLSFLDGNSQPTPRTDHIAVCLGYGSDHPQLLIHGGMDENFKTLNDVWCLDINSATWKQISAPGLQPRQWHVAALFNINTEIAEVVIFGGVSKWQYDNTPFDENTLIADTTILKMEKRSVIPGSSTKEWILTEIIHTKNLREEQRIREKKLIKVKNYEKACQQAIQNQIAVDIDVGRLNFLGLPRSGKSSTLRRLIGEILNILAANMATEQPSTGVAERKQLFIQSINKSCGIIAFGEWSKKNLVQETGIINEIIYQSIQDHNIVQKVEIRDHTNSHSNDNKSLTPSSESSETITKSTESPILQKQFSLKEREIEISENETFSIENVYSMFKEAMEQKNYEKAKYLLKDTVYLIATDHGGQTEFLDLMSRFLMGPSLNLIFSRLTDSLDKVFKIYCTNEEGISTDKEDSIVTLEEVMFQTLASIASMDKAEDSENVSSSDIMKKIPVCSSKAMFVGTFRDKVSTKEFNKQDRILKEKVEKTEFFYKNIVEYASEEHLILDLNNFNGDKEEIDRAKLLFEKVLKNNFGKVQIPCTWLMLSSNIRSENTRTITMNQCMRMARTLGIDANDLPLVLWFLHYRVGVLFYYPNVKGFENIIICDIQIIFDALTRLVKKTFIFGKAGKATIEAFKKKAQFTLTELREATKDCVDDIISMENIVTLFEHHKILAALPPQGESKEVTYFMPSVLKSATPNELRQIQSYSQVAPLMFRYECGYMPLGVFSALVISLVSLNNRKWRLKEDKLRRNKIDFLVGDYLHTVTLMNQTTFLVVVIQSQSNLPTPTASLCLYIRTILTDTLNSVNANLNYNSAEFEYAFECPSCWTFFEESHLCVVERDSYNSMLCLKDHRNTNIIYITEQKHMIWFEQENITLQNKPEKGTELVPSVTIGRLRLLSWQDADGHSQKLKILDKVCHKWKEIGDILGVDNIDAIENQREKKAEECCRDVFQKWLQHPDYSDYSATWKGICKMLEDVELSAIASELKKWIHSFS